MQNRHALARNLPMRQNIQANVALKTFRGLHFGTARWIQGDRIAFATDAEFNPGDRAELRMELSGMYSAVLVILPTYRNSLLPVPRYRHSIFHSIDPALL